MVFSFYQNLSDGSLLMFAEGLIAFCTLYAIQLGIPTLVIDALQAVLDPFKAAYLKVAQDGNFGSGDVAVKDAARAVFLTALDEFVGTWVRPNKRWSLAYLIDAGFPQPSAPGGGKIEEKPIVSLDGKPGGYVKVHARRRGAAGPGLPDIANNLVILWDYKNADGTFPAAVEILHIHCIISYSATASIDIPPTEKTREIVVYGCYVNHSGPGPWSDPVTIVIT